MYGLIERQGDGGAVETADIYHVVWKNTNVLFTSLCQITDINKQVMIALHVYCMNEVIRCYNNSHSCNCMRHH
jgi:hypothetical protein